MTAERARIIAETFADLFASELPTTRKVLQAVGHGDPAYTPDAKSRTAWSLALHLATADVWLCRRIWMYRGIVPRAWATAAQKRVPYRSRYGLSYCAVTIISGTSDPAG